LFIDDTASCIESASRAGPQTHFFQFAAELRAVLEQHRRA